MISRAWYGCQVQVRGPNLNFIGGLEPCLHRKIIKDFFPVRANIESLKSLKIFRKNSTVSSKKHYFQVTCRPARLLKLIVTCLQEPNVNVGSKKISTNQRPVCEKIDYLPSTKITKMPHRFWIPPPKKRSNFQMLAPIGLKLTAKLYWNLLYTFLVSDPKIFKRPPHP